MTKYEKNVNCYIYPTDTCARKCHENLKKLKNENFTYDRFCIFEKN